MDITKRFDRILQLFFLLQSKSVVTIEELEKRFDTSRRTIYRDLKALETAGVPLSNAAGAGYSIVEGYRIQPSRFSQEETLSLMIAEKIMQQHETELVKQHFETALIKIKGSFQVQQKNILGSLEDKLQVSAKLNAPDYLPDVINVLLKSTVEKLQADLSYIKSSETAATERSIEPVGLFYESNCWYLLAYCHLRKEYRNFRLDRIKKVKLSVVHFTMEHLPVDQLRAGLSPEQIIRITIKVERSLAHYLFWERQNFGYTGEEPEGDVVLMYFDCAVHTTSFVRWFLKYADFAEIVEPADLETELTDILLKAAGKRSIK
jgi:predicted DNA-binding transcriptional regulator YafY